MIIRGRNETISNTSRLTRMSYYSVPELNSIHIYQCIRLIRLHLNAHLLRVRRKTKKILALTLDAFSVNMRCLIRSRFSGISLSELTEVNKDDIPKFAFLFKGDREEGRDNKDEHILLARMLPL